MRVAVCQMRSGADVDANLEEADRLLREAGDGGADLAVLPELFPYLGPRAGVADVAEPVPGGRAAEMLAKATTRSGMWIVGGSVHERDGGRIYNTSPLFDRAGELVTRYRKIHLFDVELEGQPPFRESATITAGTELVSHQVEDVRAGLAICYDLRFPELFRGLMVLGADLFALPSQFQHQTGVAHWEPLLRARAIENQAFVAAAAQWGEFGSPDEPRRSHGRSMVVGPWGDVLVEAPEEGSGVWLADVDTGDLRRIRSVLPALEHRRLGLVC
ncbi:MAG TPA: carbon-nitrogen hydrolase family protein [Actinomycetota bacterium]|nr:carbon-nitrogen hydrolase family protein [Actinomycetota bacterium]